MIEKLEKNQVFIFGSNETGFHGAGSAGYAFKGNAANDWRTSQFFQKAMKSPVGSEDRIGKWAVYGVAKGYQKGREGASYAIITIKKPGQRRSTPLEFIEEQIVELFEFAEKNPNLEFLFTAIGCGYSGYTPDEMDKCLTGALFFYKQPKNVIIPPDLYENVDKNYT